MPHQEQPPVITPHDESIVPPLPVAQPAPSQTTKQEKPNNPPAVASKPPESDAPAQAAMPEQQPPAAQLDKPATSASKPQAFHSKPKESRAAPPTKRTRRATRRHIATAKPATPAASQPATFDLFGLLAADAKANGENGTSKTFATKRN